jgi:hypothetical protein
LRRESDTVLQTTCNCLCDCGGEKNRERENSAKYISVLEKRNLAGNYGSLPFDISHSAKTLIRRATKKRQVNLSRRKSSLTFRRILC